MNIWMRIIRRLQRQRLHVEKIDEHMDEEYEAEIDGGQNENDEQYDEDEELQEEEEID